MQVLDIDRVIIATEDVGELSKTFGELLNLQFGITFQDDGMESTISSDNASLDLVAPDGDGVAGHSIRTFLDDHGPGLYALALQVDDVEGAREELEAEGIEPAYELDYSDFREYFYHPRHFGGVFLALSEYPHSVEMNIRDALGLLGDHAEE